MISSSHTEPSHKRHIMAEPAKTEEPAPTMEETQSPIPEGAGTTAADAKPTSAPPSPPAPAPTDAKAALAARMARFKALQTAKESGRKATEREVRDAEDRSQRLAQLSKLGAANEKAAYKLLKTDDPDFERKRNWDYTVEESESWDKRQAKKARARDGNAFADYRAEANRVYKRQVKQLGSVDLEEYARTKGERLQQQVQSGLLQLVETDDGDVFTIDKQGRINTPVEEGYSHDHKPSKEAVDRLVNDLEKGEQARLKARAARGINDDDGGDVTYINQKNKQFNEKLARFYNRYTTEIRESFERGTAI
jgi:pre-mRNA-splicing factor SYF2